MVLYRVKRKDNGIIFLNIIPTHIMEILDKVEWIVRE